MKEGDSYHKLKRWEATLKRAWSGDAGGRALGDQIRDTCWGSQYYKIQASSLERNTKHQASTDASPRTRFLKGKLSGWRKTRAKFERGKYFWAHDEVLCWQNGGCCHDIWSNDFCRPRNKKNRITPTERSPAVDIQNTVYFYQYRS